MRNLQEKYREIDIKGCTIMHLSVISLPNIISPLRICEECVISKQHRDSFQRVNAWRAKEAMQLVHSDICGPNNPASNSSKKYFITFIDDFSRKTWVYFLQHKSKYLLWLKDLRHQLRKVSWEPLKFYIQTVVVSITHMTLQAFVQCMKLGENLQ